jgi:hypothetical protein
MRKHRAFSFEIVIMGLTHYVLPAAEFGWGDLSLLRNRARL